MNAVNAIIYPLMTLPDVFGMMMLRDKVFTANVNC